MPWKLPGGTRSSVASEAWAWSRANSTRAMRTRVSDFSGSSVVWLSAHSSETWALSSCLSCTCWRARSLTANSAYGDLA